MSHMFDLTTDGGIGIASQFVEHVATCLDVTVAKFLHELPPHFRRWIGEPSRDFDVRVSQSEAAESLFGVAPRGQFVRVQV